MISKIYLTGKQLATLQTRPKTYKQAGAQITGKVLLGNEAHLKAVRKALQEWIQQSGQVEVEMELQPIIDQIDEALKQAS